ncbi:hypothetical protein [Streptomyces sp. NPDC059063]|uniref:hypothetical protein n=1 Tax=unclassified Streptomyces TaxID=2593676 RepID=UPI0036CD7407
MTSFAPVGLSGIGTAPQQQQQQQPFGQQIPGQQGIGQQGIGQQGLGQQPGQQGMGQQGIGQQLQQLGQQQPYQSLLQQLGQQPGTQPQVQWMVGYAQAVRAPIVPFPGYEKAMILLVDGRPVQLLQPSDFAVQAVLIAIQSGQAVRVAYDDRMLVRGIEIEVPRGAIQ